MAHPPMRATHLLAVAVVAGLLAGCGQSTIARPLAQRQVKPARDVAVSSLADGFRACGATETPPGSVLATAPSGLPPVRNAAGGDVDDSTATRWASAFWREQAIESWAAVAAGQDGLLRGPCLGSARVRLTLPVGGRLAGQPKPCGGQACAVLRLTVATTSLPMLQALVLRHGGNPSRYVIQETILAGSQLDTVVVGGVYQDGPIGPIWFVEASGLDCLDPAAAGLGLDCGPGVG